MLDLLCSNVQLLDLETKLALVTYGIRSAFYYRFYFILYSDVAEIHRCSSTDDHEVTICIKLETKLNHVNVIDFSFYLLPLFKLACHNLRDNELPWWEGKFFIMF